MKLCGELIDEVLKTTRGAEISCDAKEGKIGSIAYEYSLER